MFTVSKGDLAKLLLSSKPINFKHPNLVTHNCLVNIDDQVSFLGTDLDWGIFVSLPCKCEGQERFLIEPRIFTEFARTLEGEVEVSHKDNKVTLRSESSTAIFDTQPANDYPEFPVPTGEPVVLSRDALQDIVQKGSAYTERGGRPLWDACLWEVEDGTLSVVSTNQFALSRAQVPMDTVDTSVIIPARPLKEISRLIEEEVSIYFDETFVHFVSGPVRAFVKLLGGNYYKYKQIIPAEFKCEAVVSSEELRKAASRALIVKTEFHNFMKLVIDKQVTVAVDSSKGNLKVILDSEVEGEPIVLYVQPRYVVTALTQVTQEQVVLKISGQHTPMIIQPLYEPTTTFVVMPMSPDN